MKRTTSPADIRRHLSDGPPNSRRWWVVAVLLLLVGAGLLAVGLVRHQSFLPGPPPAPTLASSSAAGSAVQSPSERRPTAPRAALPRSVPVALRIPAIGVAVSLSTLGLNPDRTVQVPTNYQQPGWFRLGPSPGQIGSAVILGHVDDQVGPAVFFRLRSLKAGDKVEVSLANGVVANFVVRTVATYLKSEFPAGQVYASHGYSALQLVTCGGQFDRRAHSYLSNVVVYTSLVTANNPLARPGAASPNQPGSRTR